MNGGGTTVAGTQTDYEGGGANQGDSRRNQPPDTSHDRLRQAEESEHRLDTAR